MSAHGPDRRDPSGFPWSPQRIRTRTDLGTAVREMYASAGFGYAAFAVKARRLVERGVVPMPAGGHAAAHPLPRSSLHRALTQGDLRWFAAMPARLELFLRIAGCPEPQLAGWLAALAALAEPLPPAPAPASPPAEPDRAARPVPRQLPAPPQLFTGRAAELAELSELDQLPDPGGTVRSHGGTVRCQPVIAAVDGAAGVGKTALALHLAHRVAGRYPDGQLCVDLTGYTEGVPPLPPEEALDRMLRALGTPGDQIPAALAERSALLRTQLAGRQMLILLDNAVDEDQVRPLLPGAHGCLVLVTSRRRLVGLDNTHTLSLDTLPLPDAVTLFTRTAGPQRMAPELPELLAETAQLCGRLPLALRIAAARLRSHPAWRLVHLVDRLRDHRHRLAELAAGQHSVTAALDLSYQQLATDQQQVYRWLGLHPGSDIGPSAVAALAGVPVATAGALLDQLLEVHLVQEPVPGRYRMHDLIRAHAAGAAAADASPGDRRAALTRLLDHYCHTTSVAMDLLYPFEADQRPRLAAASAPGVLAGAPDVLAGADPAQATSWLDTELANLLAAAGYAADHGWPQHLRHLSTTLHRHLRWRGSHPDAEALHQLALTAAQAAGDRAAQLAACRELGWVRWVQDRYGPAAADFEQALELALAAGDRPGELDACRGLGWVRWRQGRHEEALRQFGRALELARETGDLAGELDTQIGIGRVHWLQGRHRQAVAAFSRALELATATGNRIAELGARTGRGDVLWRWGQYPQASREFERALELARAAGNRPGELEALLGLARLHRLQGHYPQAVAGFTQARELAERTGQQIAVLNAIIGLGHVFRLQGGYAQAGQSYRTALELIQDIDNRNWRFEAVHGLGRLCWATGELTAALAHHHQALQLATDLDQPDDQARAHDGLAHVYRAMGRPEQAGHHWRLALDTFTLLGTDHTEDRETTTAAIRAHLRALDRPTEESRLAGGAPRPAP